MKSLGLLILLFSSLSLAATSKSVNTTFVEKTYECAQYTDNSYSKANGFETDNPAINEITVVHQRATEFVIDKNKIWEHGATLPNLSGDSRLNQGSNKEVTFFKKYSGDIPYFMAFFFDDKAAKRAVVLGQCVRK